jgi:hypothetical protein
MSLAPRRHLALSTTFHRRPHGSEDPMATTEIVRPRPRPQAAATEQPKLAAPVSERPLVSRTSILILSAFLVGAVASRLASPTLDMPVLSAAGLGVFAYLYAAFVRETKRRNAVTAARTSAITDVESRMSRHVAHITEAGPHADVRRRRDIESQYLTVVMRQAARKPR